MAEQIKVRGLKKVGLFQGLSNTQLAEIAKLCEESDYKADELCVKQGEMQDYIYVIQKGKMGVETQLPSAPKSSQHLVVEMLAVGEAYPWASLMKKTASASIRAMEPTKVCRINVDKLLALCDKDNHIGYMVMRNLASIISSRLTRHRLAMLCAVSGIGEGW